MQTSTSKMLLSLSVLFFLEIFSFFLSEAQICSKYRIYPDTIVINANTVFHVQNLNATSLPPDVWLCNWIEFENNGIHECTSSASCQHTFTTGGFHAVSFEIEESFPDSTKTCTTHAFVSTCSPGPVLATANGVSNTTVACEGTNITLNLNASSPQDCSGSWEYLWFDGSNYFDGTDFLSAVEVWNTTYQNAVYNNIVSSSTFTGKIRCSASHECTDSSKVIVNIKPTVYTLSGDTSYCIGGSGTSITLSGSETGVSYQLYKNGSPDGSAMTGTGSALTWGNKTVGTYMVTATYTSAPNCVKDMTGTALITETPVPTVNQTTNIAVCPGATINIGDFVSNPAGATFTWTNSITSIGIVANGTGQIASWTAPVNGPGGIVSTICVTPTLNGCQGTPMCFTVTIYPTPVVNPKTNIAVCPGTPINIGNFVSVPSGATFSWANSNTNIGLAASGSGNISTWTAPANNTGTNITGTITVTPTLNGCAGPPMSFTVTIYPTPTVNQITNIAVCPGSQIIIPGFGSSPFGSTFSWTNSNTAIGLLASGLGNIATWTAPQNNTGVNIVGTICVTPTLNGCQGPSMCFTVTIYPPPTVNQITNITACSGAPINIGNFASNPTGASFAWTNSNTTIGLATSGSGNIPLWTAPANITDSNIVSTVTVTPTLNGCTGIPMSFTITIYPSVTVNQKTNIVTCPGGIIKVGNFTSVPAGATFSWTNSNTAIGLVSSGTGNIPPWFAPANNTGANITGTLTVTPILNGCSGTPMILTITISPKPTVNPVTDIAVCPGTTINIGDFVSSPAGSTFDWINSDTAIGIVASGTGNIAPWTAPVNSTGLDITSTITVTSTLNGCTGTPMSFTVTINTAPQVNQKSNIAVCPGTPINMSNFVSVPSGATIDWHNSNTDIGVAASGSGNIAAWTAPANNTGSNITGTIDVTATLNGCFSSPMSFTVTIYPTPVVSQKTNMAACSGAPINIGNFVSDPTGSTFAWTNSNTAIGLPASGIGNIAQWQSPANNSCQNIVGTITVTPTLNGCTGLPMSFTVTGYPIPTVTNLTNVTVCPGAPINISNFSGCLQSDSSIWTNSNTAIGLTENGTGNIAAWTAPANNTGANISGVIIVTPKINSCQGTPMPFTVTVDATPVVNQKTNSVVCPGTSINIGTFVSTPTGATFTWTNSNTAIGLVGSGSGNITSFTAPANSTGTPISGTITVTPILNGCVGTPMNFTVTINPTPDIFNLTGGGSYCIGTNGLGITLSGSQLGINYQLKQNGFDNGNVVSGTGSALAWNNLAAGTYTVEATYGTVPNCSIIMNNAIDIIQNSLPIVNAGTDQTIPFGTSTNLSATASGGSGVFIFAWTPSSLVANPNLQSPSTLTINAITQFIVDVQDVNTTCANTDTMMILISGGPLSVFAEAQPNTICEGTNVSLNALVSGGTGNNTFTWSSVPAGFSAGIQNPVVTPSVSTTYIVSVFDGLNTETSSIGVTINPLPVLLNLSGTGSYCTGSNGLSATLSGSQIGVNYQLKKNGTDHGSAVSGTGSALVWNNLTSGTYSVAATYMATPNCAAPMNGSVVITESPNPTVFNLTGSGSYCSGNNGLSITLSGSQPGVNYQIKKNGIDEGSAISGTGSALVWDDMISGTYTVVATYGSTPYCTADMSGTVVIVENPTPAVNQKSNIADCPGSTISIGNFASNPTGATFTWTNSNTAIGLVTGGSGNIASWTAPANNTGTNITGTIAVTPLLNGCTGAPMSFTVTIYPTPTINQKTNISVCPGTPINIGAFVSIPTGATFTWINSNINIGLVASGSGNILSWAAPANNTGVNIVSTITVTPMLNGCTGNPMSFTVTIYPTPTVNQKSNNAVCPGSPINIGNFVSNPTGATFAWANLNTAIGLAASGNSNIASWTAAANNTNANIVSTITVTPTLNGCAGTPMSFTVTIFPTPTVNQIVNISACPGSTIIIDSFGSAPPGATFAWTNSNPNIGLPTNGSGNISSWTAPANNTGADITGTIAVTPTLNGCTGSPMTFTVTINPTPTVTQISNVFACPGSPVSIGNFISVPSGATFTWTNSNTAIGLLGSGTGNISQWTAPANNTGFNITGIINVSAVLNGCNSATPMSFGVIINPASSVNQMASIEACPGSLINIQNFVSNPVGANFTWTNTTTDIGLAASGSGDIAAWTAPANNTGANIIGAIDVTPTIFGCPGTPMSFTVTINPTPVLFNLSAGGIFCIGSSGLNDTLSGSQTGVNYQLLKDGIAVGALINGTGSALVWNSLPTGTYTVMATDAASPFCSVVMSGTSVIATQDIFSLTGGGSYCAGEAGSSLTLNGSQAGVNYQLKKNGTPEGLAVAGTGSSLIWNNLTTGTYTVSSTSLYCSANMTGTIDIVENSLPAVHLGADTTICQNQNITLIGPSGSGYSYIWIKLPNDTLSYTHSLYLDTLVGGSGLSAYMLIVSDNANCSGQDTINITFDICISVAGYKDFTLNVFPNPAKDNLTIVYSNLNPDIYTVEISDMLNQIVLSDKMTVKDGSGSYSINVSQLVTGIYSLSVSNGKMQVVKGKLVVKL